MIAPIPHLDVLLPFHINNRHFESAVQSCLDALPPNSRLVLINTMPRPIPIQKNDERLVELVSPGSSYISALHLGTKYSTAKYVALMNSDDLIHPSRFQRQLEEIERKKVDLVTTGIRKFGHSRRFIRAITGSSPSQFSLLSLLVGSYGADATWLFSRKWSVDLNIFGDTKDISDWTTAMRVMRHARTFRLDENLYHYRIHPEQSTHSQKSLPEEFYTSWVELNSYFDLPSLSIATINAVAAPWVHQKTLIDFRELKLWQSQYLKLASAQSRKHRNQLRLLLMRREIIMKFHNPRNRIHLSSYLMIPLLLFELTSSFKYLRY